MNIDLTNRVALVTGGATGLGKGIAKALSDANATVIITSRKKKDIKNTLKILNKKCKGYNLDLTKNNDLKKLEKKILKEFKKLDILINNIGHTLGVKDPFSSVNKWKQVMDLNFFTAVNVINTFIKSMKKNNWGRIINITSIAGIEISGPSSFNASKAALTAYSRSVGRQLAI